MDINLFQRYQTMVILWFALLMSIGLYYLFSLLAAPEISAEPANPAGRLLIVGLTALGTFLVIFSFLVKAKFLKRSVEKQDMGLVQQGMLFACAMCEVSAMLGLIQWYVVGDREYYVLILLAAAGTVFHFPRRSQLEAASYKNPA